MFINNFNNIDYPSHGSSMTLHKICENTGFDSITIVSFFGRIQGSETYANPIPTRNIQFLSSNPGRQRLKDIPSRYRYWLPSRNRVKMCYFVILASLSRGYCRNWGQRPEEVKWAFFTTKKLKRTPLICPPPMFIASLHFFFDKTNIWKK